MNDPDTTQTTTTVKLTPADATPVDKWVLTVCKTAKRAGRRLSQAGCLKFDCLPAQIAACPVTGLTPQTPYSVTAVGVRGTEVGAPSAPDTFTTKPYP